MNKRIIVAGLCMQEKTWKTNVEVTKYNQIQGRSHGTVERLTGQQQRRLCSGRIGAIGISATHSNVVADLVQLVDDVDRLRNNERDVQHVKQYLFPARHSCFRKQSSATWQDLKCRIRLMEHETCTAMPINIGRRCRFHVNSDTVP